MKLKSITFQQHKVSYTVHGGGEPVLLLHGFGEDGTIWQNQVASLEQHYKLIVPDIPGSGQSDVIPGADIEVYAAIIQLICETELAAQEKLLCFAGHSMGGYIALAFAAKHPEMLKSFCLFHSSAFADNEEKKQVRLKAIDFINEKGSYAFLKTSIPGLFAKPFRENQPEMIDQLVAKSAGFTNAALEQYYRAMIARPDRTDVLKTFDKPILFIIGEHDTAIPLQSSLQQCYLPALSYVHVLTQSGHMGMWEEKEKANTILLNFLEDIQ